MPWTALKLVVGFAGAWVLGQTWAEIVDRGIDRLEARFAGPVIPHDDAVRYVPDPPPETELATAQERLDEIEEHLREVEDAT